MQKDLYYPDRNCSKGSVSENRVTSNLTSILIFYIFMSIKVKFQRCHVKQSEPILKLAEENNGTVTSQMIDNAGLSRGCLKYLTEKGELERTARGVYIIKEQWEDELLNLSCRYRKGIFSLDTALFFHDLTDRTPDYYHMTFPTGYNLTSPKQEGLRCHTVSKELYCIGVTEVRSSAGNILRAYNKERTLCEILRPQNRTDIQLITEAFKSYVKMRDKNIPLLSEYSRIFKVEQKVRTYLEVLL